MYPCDEKVSFFVCVFYTLFAPGIKRNSFLISLLFMKHTDLRLFSISVITFATAVMLNKSKFKNTTFANSLDPDQV